MRLLSALLAPLPREEEIAEIRRHLVDGIGGGRVPLKWIEQLLDDRAEQIRMLPVLVGWAEQKDPGAASARLAAGLSPGRRTRRDDRPPGSSSGS